MGVSWAAPRMPPAMVYSQVMWESTIYTEIQGNGHCDDEVAAVRCVEQFNASVQVSFGIAKGKICMLNQGALDRVPLPFGSHGQYVEQYLPHCEGAAA